MVQSVGATGMTEIKAAAKSGGSIAAQALKLRQSANSNKTHKNAKRTVVLNGGFKYE
jgi:hypothetical protein